MNLEILNNRTNNTHENEQFRRVVSIIENAFEKLGYKGLLIGNPFNDSFYKFRADAILFYDNGLVIIDFKDYQGNIKLPPNVEEFQTTKWYNESDKDRSRLEIQAGSKFINPFRQLKYYREAFYEIVEKSLFLNGFLNPSKVCIANIFSGPFEIINEIPRNIPYYKLIQESSLGDFLYDYASDNSFSNQLSEELKKIFPAENWIRDFEPKLEAFIEEEIIEIEGNVETEIKTFLKTELTRQQIAMNGVPSKDLIVTATSSTESRTPGQDSGDDKVEAVSYDVLMADSKVFKDLLDNPNRVISTGNPVNDEDIIAGKVQRLSDAEQKAKTKLQGDLKSRFEGSGFVTGSGTKVIQDITIKYKDGKLLFYPKVNYAKSGEEEDLKTLKEYSSGIPFTRERLLKFEKQLKQISKETVVSTGVGASFNK